MKTGQSQKPCIIEEAGPMAWKGHCEMVPPDGGYHMRVLDILVPNPENKKFHLKKFQCSIIGNDKNDPRFILESVTVHPETLQTGLKVSAISTDIAAPNTGTYFLKFEIAYETA